MREPRAIAVLLRVHVVRANASEKIGLVAMHVDNRLEAVLLARVKEPVDGTLLVRLAVVSEELLEEVAADDVTCGAPGRRVERVGHELQVLLERLVTVGHAHKLDEARHRIVLEVLVVSDGDDGTVVSTGLTTREIAAKALDSVVGINLYSSQQVERVGEASGIVLDTNGYIITNAHVVSDGYSPTVVFGDGTEVAATVIGYDTRTDLAVVKVDPTGLNLVPAEFGDSDTLQLGDDVVAIGNALGYGQSVTSGYVSALNRTLTLTDESGATITSSGLIQTDAAINPGNSGGALLNMKGELIGINEAKTESTPSGGSVDNIGFAIPIDKAESSLQELMNLPTREKVDASEASYLGIEGENVSAELTELYGIPAGVVVASVEENGPAAKAGLQKGDIITELDGRTIANMQQLQDTLQYYAAGETVPFTIQRASNGQYAAQTLQVTLGSAQAEKS